jgi:hypothetical protein
MRLVPLALIAAALIALPTGIAAAAPPPQIGIYAQNVSVF